VASLKQATTTSKGRQSKGEKARVKTMIKSRNLTTDFYFISRSQLLPASLAFVRLALARAKVKSKGSKNKQPGFRRPDWSQAYFFSSGLPRFCASPCPEAGTLLREGKSCKASLCCGPLMWATTAGPQESKGGEKIRWRGLRKPDYLFFLFFIPLYY
jgi:hypothetical protein